jgi:hypothetical protein
MTAMIFGRTALTLRAAKRGVEPKSIEFATADRLIFRLGRDRPNVKFTIAARMRKTSPAKNVKKKCGCPSDQVRTGLGSLRGVRLPTIERARRAPIETNTGDARIDQNLHIQARSWRPAGAPV